MVEHGKFDILRISFLIAGHTKFSPDTLFSIITQTFVRSDVFTTVGLEEVAKQYATVVIDEGELVYKWRSLLSSPLPGIWGYHNFVFAHNPECHVQLKVCTLCYTGSMEKSKFHVNRGHIIAGNVIPTSDQSYKYKDNFPRLS